MEAPASPAPDGSVAGMTLVLGLSAVLAPVTLHHLAFHAAVHLLAALLVLALLLAGVAVLVARLALLMMLRMAGLSVCGGGSLGCHRGSD